MVMNLNAVFAQVLCFNIIHKIVLKNPNNIAPPMPANKNPTNIDNRTNKVTTTILKNLYFLNKLLLVYS